ncbi:MAG: hypothetical protein HDS59_03620 [Barnesiella sp.]|nr:hypothetical protein [Barnesiella sp.]
MKFRRPLPFFSIFFRRAGRARPESSRVGKGALAPAPRGNQAMLISAPSPLLRGGGWGRGFSLSSGCAPLNHEATLGMHLRRMIKNELNLS